MITSLFLTNYQQIHFAGTSSWNPKSMNIFHNIVFYIFDNTLIWPQEAKQQVKI